MVEWAKGWYEAGNLNLCRDVCLHFWSVCWTSNIETRAELALEQMRRIRAHLEWHVD